MQKFSHCIGDTPPTRFRVRRRAGYTRPAISFKSAIIIFWKSPLPRPLSRLRGRGLNLLSVAQRLRDALRCRAQGVLGLPVVFVVRHAAADEERQGEGSDRRAGRVEDGGG